MGGGGAAAGSGPWKRRLGAEAADLICPSLHLPLQYIYGENLVDSGRGEHCAACRPASWSSSCLPACLPAACCLQLVSHQPPASLICVASFKGTDHIRFPSRVVRRGIDWIELERPLPYDVRVAWNVRHGWGSGDACGGWWCSDIAAAGGACRRALRAVAGCESLHNLHPHLPPPLHCLPTLCHSLQSWVYRFQSTVQHSGIEGMTLEFVHGGSLFWMVLVGG